MLRRKPIDAVSCLCFVCSKAAKEAGQALVMKVPNPPFESQHHHLLHCLEKTTVKNPIIPGNTWNHCHVAVLLFQKQIIDRMLQQITLKIVSLHVK